MSRTLIFGNSGDTVKLSKAFAKFAAASGITEIDECTYDFTDKLSESFHCFCIKYNE